MTRLASLVPQAARPLRALLAATLLCGASGMAQAQGGLFDFFSQAFGSASQREPLPQPDWVQPDEAAPPLTVRRHNRPRASTGVSGSQRYNVADIKDVTIYTDKTLSRGDAVMTPTGIKVFTGTSSALPHTDEDFVAIAEASRMAPTMRKQLTAMDDASRPELIRR